MSVSSNNAFELLAKLETKNIQHLLSILSDASIRKRDFLEKTYLDRGVHFAETLQFLTDVGWVEEREEGSHLTDSGRAVSTVISDEYAIRQAILNAITSKRSIYRSPVAKYLYKFQLNGSQVIHRPSLVDRTRDRPFRDLLMDLRTVSYSHADDAYVLEDRAVPLYLWATNIARSRTKAAFSATERRNEELGFAAELAVVEYEKIRLGPHLANRVAHISAEEPFACYDIKSATVDDQKAIDRYIEVKAVGGTTFEFYWSKSELDTAQLLGFSYFLYLLPYSPKYGFDLGRLLVIADPYRNLYGNGNVWEIEEHVVLCRKRTAGTSPSPSSGG